MSYLIQQVLNSEELLSIGEILASTDEWRDGKRTLVSPYNEKNSTKNNYELSQTSDDYAKLSNIVYTAIDRCMSFADYTLPKESGPILFSKTEQGCYYKPHFDAVHLGEYANTLFLSSPDKYSGGELSLLIDGRSQKFKLKAGSMVTYLCGRPHQVCEVTEGTRNVAVFWTRSKIKNAKQRQMYSDLQRATRLLPPPIVHDTLESSQSEPLFIIEQVMHDILRYGEDL